MLLFAAASLASALPQGAPDSSAQPVVQARAAVRIVSGVRLVWDQKGSKEIPPARTTVVRTPQGSEQAKLIEFE